VISSKCSKISSAGLAAGRIEDDAKMNLAQTVVRRLMPAPADDVGQICAAIPKPDELIAAERQLSDLRDVVAKSTKRQGAIQERLTFKNPTTTPTTALEEHALDVENRELTLRVTKAHSDARKLQAEIDRLMPQYTELVAVALAPLRRRAARQLESGITAIEGALRDIDNSNAALRKLGKSPPSVMPLPFSGAFRALAAKVAAE
jgi:hypothetical protein